MNADVNLTSLLSTHFPADKSVLIARDCDNCLNTGAFALRCDDRARLLLETMFGLVEFTDHSLWENKAFLHLYESEEWVREATAVAPDYRLLQSYISEFWGERGFRQGDFILHYAGIHHVGLLRILMRYHDRKAGADRFEH